MSQDTAQPAPQKQTGSSLREAFPGYFPPDKEAIRNVMTSGLVVFDTNPLLDAYKLTGTARTEFLAALRALDDRLWIPHQVGLEFLRNRASVIDYGSGFPGRFRKAASDLHKEVQQLKEHRGLKDEDVRGIQQAIDDAVTGILDAHADLYSFGVDQGVSIDDDPVFKEVEQIIAGKVGPPLPNMDAATKIGKQRLKDKVPPGYSDVSDKGEEGALGDYLVWAQTLIEAKQRGLPVLLVTNENKADWIRTEGSYKRGPRPELVDEMLRETGQPFLLMNVRSFLFHAGQHLSATVSDSTIEQAASVQAHEGSSDDSTLEKLLYNRLVAAIAQNSNLLAELSPPQLRQVRRVLEHLVKGKAVELYSSQPDLVRLVRVLRVLEAGGEVKFVTGPNKNHHLLRLREDLWREEKLVEEADEMEGRPEDFL
ncbi:PIN-like domain-containing protein [[Actinomadura] parvosata]|uniref:PIN-like domain-containing protein n=1 Tax=[Actinomadura] parvosata TaxID=1955412 RepID=UPI00406C2177